MRQDDKVEILSEHAARILLDRACREMLHHDGYRWADTNQWYRLAQALVTIYPDAGEAMDGRYIDHLTLDSIAGE